ASLRRLPDGTGVPGGALALRLRPEPERDLAARRHLEDRERLLFTSRSVAVGEMATTLAHELNQPLGAVTNVLRGLKTRLAAMPAQPGPEAMAHLAQGVQLALDQVQYAARIIGRIRDYTQSRQPRRERVDLNALLNNSLTLLDWELRRHGVQLSIDLRADTSADGGAPVAGDGVMLQQVLVNLLRNAIDAMSDTPAGQRRLAIESRLDDAGQLEIAIADTGSGIDHGAASQLFTPFFSTKPTGMGIGLNICRSLIELHQGRLWFTPNAKRGCTFHIALPLAGPDEAGRLPRFLDAEEPVP
ncbi:sensor histidine kinase, partial [Ottowia sp.]|uniref:sensor histidine kinase n=1 Tax=Ottowia sp. TaxID=1898956 RepID=UPI0039E2DDF3